VLVDLDIQTPLLDQQLIFQKELQVDLEVVAPKDLLVDG
tara:strand:+ start:77 stop:193 length:117 start_codon:yes stop_codon:yes gene_type:complete